MSQRPGFFFVDLCHVMTDNLDLHTDEMRFRRCEKTVGTHSFLDTIRLEGCKPSSEASCKRITRNKFQGCVTPTIYDQLAL